MQTDIAQTHGYLRLIGFIKKSYPLGLHLFFSLVLFLSLSGGFIATSPGERHWPFDGAMAIGILTLFLVFFFLRVVDEVKDYEYDRVQNPDRPLVIGLVSHRDLFWFGLGTMALVVALNSWLAPVLVVIVVIDMVYGAFLIQLEKWSSTVADGLFIGLLVVYPVNILMSCYTLALVSSSYSIAINSSHIWLIVAFTLAFLHFEFSRKTLRKEFARAGERNYAEKIGLPLASALCLFFALSSSLIVIYTFAQMNDSELGAYTRFLPVVPMALAFINVTKFYFGKESPYKMGGGGMAFLLFFYLAVIIHALVVNSLGR